MAQKPVETVIGARLFPLEHEAAFIPFIIWESMEVLVEYVTSHPVIKPRQNIVLLLWLEFLEFGFAVDLFIPRDSMKAIAR